MFKLDQNETTVAHCGFRTIKYQHDVARVAQEIETRLNFVQQIAQWAESHADSRHASVLALQAAKPGLSKPRYGFIPVIGI